MQSAENVVNRIVDLDERAERIRDRAREEAETIRLDAKRRIAEEKAELEKRIAEKITDIEAAEAHSRKGEIARVRKEYTDQAGEVVRAAPEKMDRVVNTVLARLKGISG
jgi:vacuolar-type H+-ATPase subunit E/Vma4